MTKKKKILIVDDEYVLCKAMKAFLKEVGYDVIISTSGEQALDMVEEEKPDIITLDIRMPGMNGYEVLEKVGREKDRPVIIISAIDIPDMENRLLNAGAAAVLHKPVDLKLLLETIKKLEGR